VTSDGVSFHLQSNIVERLRRQIATTTSNHLLCYEAADEIERLTKADEWCRMTIAERDAEIERLRADNAALQRQYIAGCPVCDQQRDMAEAVLAHATVEMPAELIEMAKRALGEEIVALRSEGEEQARLLGMSGSREAKMLAEIERLRADAPLHTMHSAALQLTRERLEAARKHLPPGYAIVPTDPTDAMIAAASETTAATEVNAALMVAQTHGFRPPLSWDERAPLSQMWDAMIGAS
jgi:hypothetical protein